MKWVYRPCNMRRKRTLCEQQIIYGESMVILISNPTANLCKPKTTGCHSLDQQQNAKITSRSKMWFRFPFISSPPALVTPTPHATNAGNVSTTIRTMVFHCVFLISVQNEFFSTLIVSLIF